MHDNLPVFLVFLSQILLVSVYLPLRRFNTVSEIFETHPPSEYPKYYPRTIEFERRRLVIGRNLPLFIALVGIGFFCVAWVSNYSLSSSAISSLSNGRVFQLSPSRNNT